MKDKIVQLVMQGCGTEQIAERLHMAEDDVERQMSEILATLGLNSRVEFLLYAYSCDAERRKKKARSPFVRSNPPSLRLKNINLD